MASKVDELAEAYRDCTIGYRRGPVHAIMSAEMIVDLQPRLKDHVEPGCYYELTAHADGRVTLTKVQ